MKNKVLFLLLALAAMILPTSVWAAGNAPARLIPVAMAQKLPVPSAQKLVVPVAQLMRVDEGVFELEVGKSIDLTDRKILLSLVKWDKKCCRIVLNGEDDRNHSFAGARFNLKRERSTASFVKDKEVCVLDVVDVALPKGAPGIFTFRLYCL